MPSGVIRKDFELPFQFQIIMRVEDKPVFYVGNLTEAGMLMHEWDHLAAT